MGFGWTRSKENRLVLDVSCERYNRNGPHRSMKVWSVTGAQDEPVRCIAYVLDTASLVRKHPAKRPSVLSVVHGAVRATSMERCAEGAP